MRATGPRGLTIDEVSLNGRPMLRVKMHGTLIGRGFFATPEEALRALRPWGINPDDIVFDYTEPADAVGEDPDCE